MYGEWWIETRKRPPKDYRPPSHSVAGDLLADGPSDWTLETIGSLTSESIWPHMVGGVVKSKDELATIRGADNSGKSYSLLGCYDIQAILQSSNIREGVQRWVVSTIVEGNGIWVNPESEVEAITLSFRDLAAWATDVRNPPYAVDTDTQIVSFHWSRNDDESVVQDCSVEFRHGVSWSISDSRLFANVAPSIAISDTLEIQQVAEKWIHPINALMSLLTMRPSYPTVIRADLAMRFGREHSIDVNMRIPQQLDRIDDDNGEEESFASRQQKMLATRVGLQEASVNFESLLGGWFAIWENDKLRVAFERLADSQARTSGFSFEDSLLHACNGIEGLHAARFDGGMSEDADMKEILIQLQEAVPDSHKDLFSNRLSATRSKSFPEKTNEIAQGCGDMGRTLLEAYPDLVADINEFRKRAAHASTKPRDVNGQIDVLVGSQWLLRHYLLQELGIATSECDAIILQNFTFQKHMQRLQERHRPKTASPAVQPHATPVTASTRRSQ